MNFVMSFVNEILDCHFGGCLPANQPEGTAFSMILAFRLGSMGATEPVLLLGKAHKPAARRILAESGVLYLEREWPAGRGQGIDYSVFDHSAWAAERPRLISEAEMHLGHGSGLDIDAKYRDGSRVNGLG